jgi:hypothetical protein
MKAGTSAADSAGIDFTLPSAGWPLSISARVAKPLATKRSVSDHSLGMAPSGRQRSF